MYSPEGRSVENDHDLQSALAKMKNTKPKGQGCSACEHGINVSLGRKHTLECRQTSLPTQRPTQRWSEAHVRASALIYPRNVPPDQHALFTSSCFFFEDTAMSTVKKRSVHTDAYAAVALQLHACPACRCSPSTSQAKGRFPSAPPGARRPTKVHANARAVAQESNDHHPTLQACSTCLRNNCGSAVL